MYKIIGADGKEYGPVTAEQLKQWSADGRANQQTQIRAEGETVWKTVGEIPELAVAQPITPAPAGAFQTDRAPAADRVKGPAIALIVTASLGIAYYLFSGVFALIMGDAMVERSLPSNIPPELQSVIQSLQGPMIGFIYVAIAALNALVLFGAISLLRLRSYGLALTACILAMLPCQCCCVLGLPFGIWGLVVMSKPEVKSAFR
jgi:hypothetical protein